MAELHHQIFSPWPHYVPMIYAMYNYKLVCQGRHRAKPSQFMEKRTCTQVASRLHTCPFLYELRGLCTMSTHAVHYPHVPRTPIYDDAFMSMLGGHAGQCMQFMQGNSCSAIHAVQFMQCNSCSACRFSARFWYSTICITALTAPNSFPISRVCKSVTNLECKKRETMRSWSIFTQWWLFVMVICKICFSVFAQLGRERSRFCRLP